MPSEFFNQYKSTFVLALTGALTKFLSKTEEVSLSMHLPSGTYSKVKLKSDSIAVLMLDDGVKIDFGTGCLETHIHSPYDPEYLDKKLDEKVEVGSTLSLKLGDHQLAIEVLEIKKHDLDNTLRFRERLGQEGTDSTIDYAVSQGINKNDMGLKKLTRMFDFQSSISEDFGLTDGIMKNFDEVVDGNNEKETDKVTPLTAKFQIRLVGNVIKLYGKFEDYPEKEIAVCDKFGKKKGTVDLLGFYPNTVENLLDAGLIERASGHSILSEETYQFPLDFSEKEFPVNSKTVKELTFER